MRMRMPAPVRFVATVLGLVLVFGGGASLFLGAFDKAQTNGTEPLSLGSLVNYNVHFLQQLVSVVTNTTTDGGVPFRSLLLLGLATTIEYCFIAMPVALAFGLLLALMSRSPRAILRIPARSFVEFFRNTPLVVQALAIYWALPLPNWFLTSFTAGVAVLILNYAAYECENLRTGLAALDRGQGEAAATLGLSAWQSLRLVIFPQMVPVVLPPVVNDLIFMYKDSAVLSLIAVQELTEQTNGLARSRPALSWQVFLLGALLYLALSLPLARVARVIERRLRSATLLIRRDLSIASLQVLGIMVVAGWICGLVVQGSQGSHGITPGDVAGSLGQLLAAFGLALLLLAFTLVVLGGIVYGVSRLIGWIPKRRPSMPEPRTAQPAVQIEQ
jgi:His/Glu/Gln/Arg/opine family amino acid ABC transporter permease subunit